ncbi:heparanase-like [Manduca sexta]|uniref:Heparanase n=1 Tax=Manduca sexta TaxID=7130 RepID=A0A921ZP37_MANSE|nr:heparanase-like [Manduca sexta]KAG6461637.1 hypothetical protein O3G_MSEX012759 [Manduca sexta]
MMSNKRLVATCAIAFCCNVALLVLFVKYNGGTRYHINIDKHQEVKIFIPDNFLSIGIDTSEIQDYDKIDFKKQRLRDLASALAPARLRLGGTMSERLIFSKNDATVSCDVCVKNSSTSSVCSSVNILCKQKFLPFFIMTGDKWTQINEFCEKCNLTLLFTFNALLRDQHGWNEKNAKELLEYSKHKHFKIDWQLGNEPNSFQHVFGTTIKPHALGHDFEKLRKLLNHNGYKHSLLVGPDTTRPQPSCHNCLQYMLEFLGNASHHINVRSWHQYYLNSRTAKLEDFWNPDTFDLLKEQIETMKNHTMKYNKIPMWLTETSSSYGGGAPGLSNSYAGSPLWIDKLGLSATYNITTVIRQSLIGGNYSLLDDELEPLPDWWLSVLYKRLVGNEVLKVTSDCTRSQRLYAHCTNKKYMKGAVTLFAINLKMAKVRFLLNGTALHGKNLHIDEYIISTPSNNRRSKTVLLNGWPLYYESSLPNLQPRHLKYGRDIAMPPYSIGFWVIKNTTIKACQ